MTTMETETAREDAILIDSSVEEPISTENALVCAPSFDNKRKMWRASKRILELNKQTSSHLIQLESKIIAFGKHMCELVVAIQQLFSFYEDKSVTQEGFEWASRLAVELAFHSFINQPLHLVYLSPSKNRKEKSSYLRLYKLLLSVALEVPETQEFNAFSGTKQVDHFIDNFELFVSNASRMYVLL
jgi:hypothetical protein